MPAQVDGGGGRQAGAPGQVVVEKEPRADHPCRSQMRGVRHDEVQRTHDVRGGVEQYLALLQRLAHQREVILLQVAQAAVDQLGAGGGGVRGQIVLLAKQHREAPPGCVARDAGAVDSPAHDQQVVGRRRPLAHARRARWP